MGFPMAGLLRRSEPGGLAPGKKNLLMLGRAFSDSSRHPEMAEEIPSPAPAPLHGVK